MEEVRKRQQLDTAEPEAHEHQQDQHSAPVHRCGAGLWPYGLPFLSLLGIAVGLVMLSAQLLWCIMLQVVRS